MKTISLIAPAVVAVAVFTAIGSAFCARQMSKQTIRCDPNIYVVVTTHHWFGDTQQCVSRAAIQGPSLFQTPTKD